MLLVSYIQQYFNTSITVLTNQVWKLPIALFKVPNTGAFTVLETDELSSAMTSPCEWVLVHGLDVGQIGDREEEDAGVCGDGLVTHTCLVDHLLRLLGDRLLLRDLVGEDLGGGEDLDGCLVLQDVPFGGWQHFQDLVLNIVQLPRKWARKR